MHLPSLITGILIGTILTYPLLPAPLRTSPLTTFRTSRRKKIEERKERILEALRQKGSIQNDDISALLQVSDATATRYMDELEKEGKVVQVGKTGKGVTYRLI